MACEPLTSVISTMPGESLAAALLFVLGIVQLALSFIAARNAGAAMQNTRPRPHREVLVRRMRRPVHGFRILAFLSFLTAALAIAIPLYLNSRYGI
ncbi:MAG TPA: hypothetical protein PK573_13135 [Spirochaetota bacterium]|nr:hypothetical protein [Spirochaetota bacterium]HRZ28462.1 hypothetical protein [Spirochaetota bacterium]